MRPVLFAQISSALCVLGDSFLKLTATSLLFHENPDWSEVSGMSDCHSPLRVAVQSFLTSRRGKLIANWALSYASKQATLPLYISSLPFRAKLWLAPGFEPHPELVQSSDRRDLSQKASKPLAASKSASMWEFS